MATRKAPAKKEPARKPPGGGAKSAKAKKPAARSKAATAAAAAAKAANARGKRLNASKAALRDSLIVARKAQDWPWEAIAAEAGITPRRCQQIVEEHRGIKSPLEELPMRLLEDLSMGLKLSIGDFEAMAAAHAEVNPAVALGAKKAANEARRDLLDLLQAVGKLPENLELFRTEAEMQRLAEQMVEKIEGVASGDVTPYEALMFFRGLVMRPGDLPAPHELTETTGDAVGVA